MLLHSKLFRRLLGLAALAVTLPVMAQDVRTDYDHKADFTKFHTYCWSSVKTANPFMAARLQDAIRLNLNELGWTEAQNGACDVSINAVGTEHLRPQYNTFGMGGGGWGPGWGYGPRWGGWGGPGWGGGSAVTNVYQIPVGNLVVDMYNARTHDILWRGTSRQDLSEKPEKNIGKLNKAVDKMFREFPPRPE